MEVFSDGVFAIAITLLVLQIGVPSGSENDLLRALVAEWPSYMAYLVSFATIGAVWFGHTVITEYLDHANSTFIRLICCYSWRFRFSHSQPGCLPSTPGKPKPSASPLLPTGPTCC